MEVRYYYRCVSCLSVATLQEKAADLQCVCGGRVEFLGPVTRVAHYARTEVVPKCDGRCVNAQGPTCDCPCGGENHGTGLAGYVERTREEHVVLHPPDLQSALRRAAEFQEAKEKAYSALSAEFGVFLDDYMAGKWIPSRAKWEEVRMAVEAYLHACRLKTHQGRLKALERITQRYWQPERVQGRW